MDIQQVTTRQQAKNVDWAGQDEICKATITLVLQAQEISGCIIDGGSNVNVINTNTCKRLGITDWEACPFWLRMVDTSSVKPLGLIQQLDMSIGGRMF